MSTQVPIVGGPVDGRVTSWPGVLPHALVVRTDDGRMWGDRGEFPDGPPPEGWLRYPLRITERGPRFVLPADEHEEQQPEDVQPEIQLTDRGARRLAEAFAAALDDVELDDDRGTALRLAFAARIRQAYGAEG